MNGNHEKTALVTGATSGLGFEAAAQLADRAYGRVIITGRTYPKAEGARAALQDRTGRRVFETLALDNDRLSTVEEAGREMAARGNRVDTLILNAGIAPPVDLRINEDGIESTVASSLIGHHLFTMRLIENGLLADGARIVIASSEAARGDVPTFAPVNIDDFAAEHFGNDRHAAIEAYMKMEQPARYKASDTYATAKQFVNWWAAELASRLPEGTTVNAVSPGSTPDTNAIKNAPFYMRYLMIPIFKLIPGMSHSVGDGAKRYLDAVSFGDDVNGKFFASPPKKMTGRITEMSYDHLNQPDSQAALWDVASKLANGVGYPVNH